MSGLYIHIPFCKQACSYCDFYFVTRQKLLNPFVDSLVNEIRFYKGSKFVQEPVQTIYIGGGTPSLLNEEQLGRIFSAVHEVFQLDLKEVTMELNPDDVTPAYLKMIQRFGVDRASMGVQSFQEEILTFMHRAHNQTEALQALEALQATGFPSFTADLIYGNPGQTLAMLEQDITQLLKFDPPHISAYSLTVEPKTRLGKQVELGRIEPPDDEIVSEHSDLLFGLLEGAGIHQYEVSNYAKPGKEAVHNSSYWNHKNYLGYGPAAHSFWWDEKSAKRWKNRPDINHYLGHDPAEYAVEEESLDGQKLAEERLMLGLRTVEGVSLRELKQQYGFEFSDRQMAYITDQSECGTVEVSEHQLKLTREGLKISDLLLVDLLSRG